MPSYNTFKMNLLLLIAPGFLLKYQQFIKAIIQQTTI